MAIVVVMIAIAAAATRTTRPFGVASNLARLTPAPGGDLRLMLAPSSDPPSAESICQSTHSEPLIHQDLSITNVATASAADVLGAGPKPFLRSAVGLACGARFERLRTLGVQ